MYVIRCEIGVNEIFVHGLYKNRKNALPSMSRGICLSVLGTPEKVLDEEP